MKIVLEHAGELIFISLIVAAVFFATGSGTYNNSAKDTTTKAVDVIKTNILDATVN